MIRIPLNTTRAKQAMLIAAATGGVVLAGVGLANAGSTPGWSHLSLRGDIDGDGRADLARILHHVRDGHSDYLLKVDSTRYGLVSTVLKQRGIDPDRGWIPGELPTLAAIARVRVANDRKMEIIAVNLVEGAEREGLGVYHLRRESGTRASLERLAIGGPPPSPPWLKDIFPYSGSNASVAGIDCSPRIGSVVEGVAAPYGAAWRLRETFYVLREGRFLPVRVRSSSVHKLPHEFLHGPFGNCAATVP